MAVISFFDTKELEWKDIAVMIAGSNLKKFTNVSYAVSQEMEELYAAGDDPLDIQTGDRKYEGSLTLLKSAVDDMNLAARAAGGRDILDVKFDIVITYKANDNRRLITDTLVGCRFSQFEFKAAQGDKKMEIVMPFKFTRLLSR
ncbi:hypothetical protein EBZ39_04870 [bacterium]|nr:hypothetical protein [bacterium]